ncbi:MAG: ATP-dependent exonuclease V, alpha subunit-helicase superfamily I member [candidate division TM6 bacterium GW2011_GWE2_41_16]|nr:MAG: ATP-dependent exonuclease V, alpha subunit-helicase superfamily I member [candidate division TM6 bacterium GW2011_GWE2_41_16]
MITNKVESEEPISSYEGTVERIVYQNVENGFAVLRFMPTNMIGEAQLDLFTVCGTFPILYAGAQICIEGNWTKHATFGDQFAAVRCTQLVPTSIIGIKKFLGSGLIKGIGEKYAEAIVNKFGKMTLTIIDEFPDRLLEVSGIGERRITSIKESWGEQKEIAAIMVFLQGKDISPLLATKIYKQYAASTIEMITQNPYRLAEDIWGIGFKTADAIALRLGFTLHDARRIRAGVLYVLREITVQGHLYYAKDQLYDLCYKTLGIESDQSVLVESGISGLCADGLVAKYLHQEIELIGLAKHFALEQACARMIQLIAFSEPVKKISSSHIRSYLADEHILQVQLSEQQKEGVFQALTSKVSIITGGPGTGKTTLLKSLISILELEGISYRLAAPTGRAAQRMSESTTKPALTIHRLLEFDVRTMGFARNASNQLKSSFVIIDEASMLDIFLAHSLLSATHEQSHIVFIGDIDQLPSVGAGSFLLDCIKSQQIPCVRLREIFRQAQGSLIVLNAHRINAGEMPLTSSEPGKEFIYIPDRDPEHLTSHIRNTLFKTVHAYGLMPTDVQVLVPMNRGVVGTIALNKVLQDMLNPSARASIALAGYTLREGDKVMQIRNNYTKDVFNGDIGIVHAVDQESRLVEVFFDDRSVSYEADELSEIVLAYATTIHKGQGSEYPAVIVPLFMQHYMLLQRNLLYTALTRAKKLCILIGEPKAIAIATKNNKSTQRLTLLQSYLKQRF